MKRKDNYAAWEIDVEAFPKEGDLREQLSFLLRFAILAPSSHNCQPWWFVIDGNTVHFYKNQERIIPVADPSDRLLSIAFGCAAEFFTIAAEYYGFEAKVLFRGGDGKETPVLSIDVQGSYNPANKPDHLIHWIRTRASNRSPYEARSVDPQVLVSFQNIQNDHTRLTLITDPTLKSIIADIMILFRLRAFGNKPFRQEMADYKRHNLTRASVGMPGFTMGFPTLLSFISSFVIRHVNVMKAIWQKELWLLKEGTPMLAMLTTKENTKEDWMAAGRVYGRLLLTAHRAGLQTATQALPYPPGELSYFFDSYTPHIAIRIGYCSALAKHSPRLSVKEVLS